MITEITTWQELRDAVGVWSQANFSTQAGIGALAPLMGMCEEAGEYAIAETGEEEDDALGDVLIFLMDYCYRSRVSLQDLPPRPLGLDQDLSLAATIGKLTHIQLKRLQRIRGMADYETFRDSQFAAVEDVINAIHLRTTDLPDGAFTIAKRVWESVVSKRKWKDCADHVQTRDACLYDFGMVVSELHPE